MGCCSESDERTKADCDLFYSKSSRNRIVLCMCVSVLMIVPNSIV